MNNINHSSSVAPALEIKGRAFTLPILKILGADMAAVAILLADKVGAAPEFFRDAPVVIDVEGLDDGDGIDFALLVGLLRGHGMIPVGVRGAGAIFAAQARALELAILSNGVGNGVSNGAVDNGAGSGADEARATAVAEPATPAPATIEPAPGSLRVTRPVRSGQRLYAPGGDLIVLAPVSAGAEIMADGNIHVYGALRGRALAGVRGDTDSRIFCQELQAELVSIAGDYRVSEDLGDTVGDGPVQIFLDDGVLKIEALRVVY